MEFDSIEKVREFYIPLLRIKVLEFVFDRLNRGEQSRSVVVKVNTKLTMLQMKKLKIMLVKQKESVRLFELVVRLHLLSITIIILWLAQEVCHKKMSVAAKSLIERFDEEGLPMGKV
ncbi:unnamed protein product [Lupinus luteus]|uniref:Uncharacterized protein n=1 Tax=Lupinus luteus TaxID=3873 RepID=A0AAV1WZ49_LUPLU